MHCLLACRVKFLVEQGLGHQVGSARGPHGVSFAKKNTRQKLTMRNGFEFFSFFVHLALLPPVELDTRLKKSVSYGF